MLLIAESVRLPSLHAIVSFSSFPPTLSVPPCWTVIGPPPPFAPPMFPPPMFKRFAPRAIAITIATRIASPMTRYDQRNGALRGGGAKPGSYPEPGATAVVSASPHSNSRIRFSGSSGFICQMVPHRLAGCAVYESPSDDACALPIMSANCKTPGWLPIRVRTPSASLWEPSSRAWCSGRSVRQSFTGCDQAANSPPSERSRAARRTVRRGPTAQSVLTIASDM